MYIFVSILQGVQAQTMANFFLAFNLDLPIIPVLNKIDLPGAQPDVVLKQLHTVFDIEPETVLQVGGVFTIVNLWKDSYRTCLFYITLIDKKEKHVVYWHMLINCF